MEFHLSEKQQKEYDYLSKIIAKGNEELSEENKNRFRDLNYCIDVLDELEIINNELEKKRISCSDAFSKLLKIVYDREDDIFNQMYLEDILMENIATEDYIKDMLEEELKDNCFSIIKIKNLLEDITRPDDEYFIVDGYGWLSDLEEDDIQIKIETLIDEIHDI